MPALPAHGGEATHALRDGAVLPGYAVDGGAQILGHVHQLPHAVQDVLPLPFLPLRFRPYGRGRFSQIPEASPQALGGAALGLQGPAHGQYALQGDLRVLGHRVQGCQNLGVGVHPVPYAPGYLLD